MVKKFNQDEYGASLEQLKANLDKNEFFYLDVKKQKVLLIEDGSVDTDKLDALGINYIVYRQGSQKPEIIEI
jgi:RNA binding exosome subunit